MVVCHWQMDNQNWSLDHWVVWYDIRLSCSRMLCTSTEIMVADHLSKNWLIWVQTSLWWFRNAVSEVWYFLSESVRLVGVAKLCMRGPPTADMQDVSHNNRERESLLVHYLLCSNRSVLGFCAKTLQLWTFSLLTRSSLTNDQWVLANDQWVLKHAQYVNAKGVLIIPAWESPDFWPVIVHLTVQSIKSNVLNGKSDFDFAAFLFRF